MFKSLFILAIGLTLSCTSVEKKDKLSLMNGDKKILVYNAGYVPSPKKEAPWYGRSGFIHPVLTPKGQVVTDGFPDDHMHHHGLMFAWTSSKINGRKVDFWNSQKKQGFVEHVETVSVSDSKIVVKLRHIDPKVKQKVVIEETWEITKVDHASINVFDMKSTQVCVLKEGLDIDKYHYGALCVRSVMGFSSITNESNDRIKANHSKPAWVAMSGVNEGEPCGIAAIQHKGNFRFPQAVRIHPKMPYFCYAPMVAGKFRLEAGTPYVSQFRFVAFDGKVNAQELNKIAAEYNKN